MTIILDCNIYISLVIAQQIDVVPKLQNSGWNIACCDQLLFEIADILRRPKLNRYLSASTFSDVLRLIRNTTISFQIFDIPDIVADPNDNYLFALCKASKADYFVTGDKLLLAEKNYQHTKIISFAEFKLLIA